MSVMRRWWIGGVFLGLLAVGIASGWSDAWAVEGVEGVSKGGFGSNPAAVARGGRIYDNWAMELGERLPKKRHPAYPVTGVLKGAATWRCPACHGWDYQGDSGINGEGSSHYTGIKGLHDLTDLSPGRLDGILRGKNHQYRTTMISEEEVFELAAFIQNGLVDMEPHIDRLTRKASGDPRDGADFYHSLCSRCHGVDGRFRDPKSGGASTPLGSAANINPWKAMHKIRNGQPGSKQPSFIVLLDQSDFNNILAHIQALPDR